MTTTQAAAAQCNDCSCPSQLIALNGGKCPRRPVVPPLTLDDEIDVATSEVPERRGVRGGRLVRTVIAVLLVAGGAVLVFGWPR